MLMISEVVDKLILKLHTNALGAFLTNKDYNYYLVPFMSMIKRLCAS